METTQKQQEFVKLLSNDGVEFTAPVNILLQSPVLAKMLEGPFRESSLKFTA